jgi:hypothetical protein
MKKIKILTCPLLLTALLLILISSCKQADKTNNSRAIR